MCTYTPKKVDRRKQRIRKRKANSLNLCKLKENLIKLVDDYGRKLRRSRYEFKK